MTDHEAFMRQAMELGEAAGREGDLGIGAVIVRDGKVQIVVSVTSDLIGRLKAGQIVKEIAPIVGGAGGGRPDFAEAGGRQPEKIDEMLKASEAVIGRLLG